MSNFISWAIGEIPQKTEVEQIQIPEVKEPKSFTQMLEVPESKESTESVEKLEKVESKVESESMTTLEVTPTKESTSVPIEMIKVIDNLESQYTEIEKLKVESSDSVENTIFTKMGGISMEDYDKKESIQINRLRVSSESSKDSEIETLHNSVVKTLDEYFTEHSMTESLSKDYTSALSSLSKAVESSMQQEPLAIGLTYNEYFSNLNAFVEKLDATDELKSELAELLFKLKSSAIETIKVEYLTKNPDSNVNSSDIEKLEIRIQDYPQAAIAILDKYASESQLEKLTSLTATFDMESKPDDKDFFEKYAAYVKPLDGNIIELGTSAVLGIASLGNIDPKVLDGANHAIDTLASRFGWNSKLRGINYTIGEFKSYTELALRILQKSKAGVDGNYFPFTAENLVFAATFWMFLDPLKYIIKITDAGKTSSLITYANIYKYFNMENSPYYTPDLKAASISISNSYKRLPFKGRDSVRDLELRNAFDWDIELKALDVAGSKPPEFIPYNVDPESKSLEGIHHWLPVSDYTFNVSSGVTDSVDLYGVKNLMIPGVKWNLSGSLTFFDTSRLWINRWRSEYLRYLYGDKGIGSYILHPYQQCCYLLTIYLFDSVDHITQSTDKDRFLKKYQLVILPQLGIETYNGSSVDKTRSFDFDVVGVLDTSVLKLGDL